MKRFLINCHTAWCGESQTFSAYAESDSDKDLNNAVESAAYDNFNSYSGTGFEGVGDESELTEEQLEKAYAAESKFYGFSIEEWDETNDESEWEWHELIYDRREKDAEV